MKFLQIALLFSLASLWGCGLEKCKKETREVECDEETNSLEICNPGDFIIRVDCGDLFCNESAAACDLCGDGTLVSDQGEQCDDANFDSGDGCSAACQLEFCGDNIVTAALGEECDDGNRDSGDGCDALCQLEICGDGIVQGAEECDDGNQTDNDNCSNQCISNDVNCGNGALEGNEVCDDGNNDYADGCRGDCRGIEVCGDGEVDIDVGEQCDDGNFVLVGDACNNQCQSLTNKAVNCNAGNDLDAAINAAVNNSVITISGICNNEIDQTINITNKQGIVIVGEAGAAIAPTGDFRVFNILGSSVAILNLDLSAPANAAGSQVLLCDGASTLLIDRTFIHDQEGDRDLEIKGTSKVIVSNSVLANHSTANKDIIKITEQARLDLIHATFADNLSTEEGIIESNAAQCRFDGVIGQNNGNDPVKETRPVTAIAPANDTFSIVQGENFFGNLNVPPLIDTANGFHLLGGSPAINAGNPSPDPAVLIFNPITIFGVNPYDHDKDGNFRIPGSADAGAFEDF